MVNVGVTVGVTSTEFSAGDSSNRSVGTLATDSRIVGL
jgi:hypothetical protein